MIRTIMVSVYYRGLLLRSKLSQGRQAEAMTGVSVDKPEANQSIPAERCVQTSPLEQEAVRVI